MSIGNLFINMLFIQRLDSGNHCSLVTYRIGMKSTNMHNKLSIALAMYSRSPAASEAIKSLNII